MFTSQVKISLRHSRVARGMCQEHPLAALIKIAVPQSFIYYARRPELVVSIELGPTPAQRSHADALHLRKL